MTSIGKSAFRNCGALTSLTIGQSVSRIKAESFANCKRLTDIYSLAKNVPNTNTNAFIDSVIESATLHVPAELVDAYKAVAPWKNFKKVVALIN